MVPEANSRILCNISLDHLTYSRGHPLRDVAGRACLRFRLHAFNVQDIVEV